MKILTKDTSGKALLNQKIQLQIKGKDSGFLSLSTDANGCLTLDDKYRDQQIAAVTSGTPGNWIKATDGITLTLNKTPASATSKDKSRTTTK